MVDIQTVPRLPLYVRQRNAETHQQLRRLRDQLPDQAWPADEEGEIFIAYSGRYSGTEMRELVARAISDEALANLSLDPFEAR